MHIHTYIYICIYIMLKGLANLTNPKAKNWTIHKKTLFSSPDPWISSKSFDKCTWIGPGTLVWKPSKSTSEVFGRERLGLGSFYNKIYGIYCYIYMYVYMCIYIYIQICCCWWYGIICCCCLLVVFFCGSASNNLSMCPSF